MPILSLEFVFRPPSTPNLHKLTDSVLVQALEGIFGKDSFLHVFGKKLACVIPAESESHLGQVVCTKGEEFRMFGNLISCNGLLSESQSWFPTR